jgi:hypothetical protein
MRTTLVSALMLTAALGLAACDKKSEDKQQDAQAHAESAQKKMDQAQDKVNDAAKENAKAQDDANQAAAARAKEGTTTATPGSTVTVPATAPETQATPKN